MTQNAYMLMPQKNYDYLVAIMNMSTTRYWFYWHMRKIPFLGAWLEKRRCEELERKVAQIKIERVLAANRDHSDRLGDQIANIRVSLTDQTDV